MSESGFKESINTTPANNNMTLDQLLSKDMEGGAFPFMNFVPQYYPPRTIRQPIGNIAFPMSPISPSYPPSSIKVPLAPFPAFIPNRRFIVGKYRAYPPDTFINPLPTVNLPVIKIRFRDMPFNVLSSYVNTNNFRKSIANFYKVPPHYVLIFNVTGGGYTYGSEIRFAVLGVNNSTVTDSKNLGLLREIMEKKGFNIRYFDIDYYGLSQLNTFLYNNINDFIKVYSVDFVKEALEKGESLPKQNLVEVHHNDDKISDELYNKYK